MMGIGLFYAAVAIVVGVAAESDRLRMDRLGDDADLMPGEVFAVAVLWLPIFIIAGLSPDRPRDLASTVIRCGVEHPMTQHSRGGIRPPDYLREMHLSRVEDLMVQAIPWPRIVAILADEGITDSDDTAKKWRQEITRRWATEDAAMRGARKDLWRARLEKQYSDVLERARATKSDHAFSMLHAEATRIAKVAIVLDGLTQPVTVTGDGRPDPASMSPADRAREIDKLLERKRASEARATTDGGN